MQIDLVQPDMKNRNMSFEYFAVDGIFVTLEINVI